MRLDGDTWALVVGISEYDFAAPLPGATNAAIQFAKLLCDRGVKPEQIYLQLSPLPEQVSDLPPGVRKGEAKYGSMRSLIQNELKGAEGQTLCVFSAGHGAAVGGARRLYLADSRGSGWTFDCEKLLCRRRTDTDPMQAGRETLVSRRRRPLS